MTEQDALAVATKLIEFLETGTPPAGLFASDVLLDFTPPLWRVQTKGVDDAVAVRLAGHPGPGKVTAWRCDPTPRGFVLEFEERWVDHGRDWYAREMLRADVTDSTITELSVYCTGDWTAERVTQHAREVRLIRP